MQAELMQLEAQSIEIEREELKRRSTTKDVEVLMVDEKHRTDELGNNVLKA